MSFSKLMQLINLAKKCGLDQEEWFIKGLESLSIRWNENLYKKLLDTCLYNSRIPLLNTTFPVPVTKEELAAVGGPYKVGTIDGTSIQVGFTPTQIQMHALIGGGAGYGKSSLVKILCQQILTEGKRHIWIIDPKGEGGDFRFLARDFGVLLLRPDTIRCNPFTAIPNVPREMLRELVCEVTADSFGVYDASEGLMAKHTQRIFEQFQEPTLHDFIASIRTEKGSIGGRKQGYLDSLDTRLTKAQISLGNIINCKSDYFSELYNKSVIFEIGELSGSAQRVLIPWIILKLVLYKIKNQTQQLSHLLVFNEAQANLFSRELFENRGRTSFMATLATQCRAFGLGIMVLAQNPCMKLIREIIANSCIKVCFQLGSGEEVLGMSRHMGLTPEQMEAIYHLDRQEVVCRVGLGYTEPIKVRINDFPDQPVTNAELADIMRDRWKELLKGIKPAKSDSNMISKPSKAEKQSDEVPIFKGTVNVDDDLFEAKIKADKKVSEIKASDDTVLSPDEQSYLRILATHPYRLITEVYAILGDEKILGNATISQARAVKIRQKLIQLKLIDSFSVSGTGRPGKPQSDLLASGIVKTEHPRGGKDHSWWCYRVSSYYKAKGADVKLGSTVSGNELDINVAYEGKHIGIEIVVSSIVIENLANHIKFYDEIKILAIDERKSKEIAKMINGMGNDIKEKVSVELLKDRFIAL